MRNHYKFSKEYKDMVYKRVLNKLKSIYKDTIDFSKFVEFHDNTKTEETFKCNKHNIWFKRRLDLMQKGHTGCPLCRKDNKTIRCLNRRLTTEEFVKRANIVNGNKYTYEKAVYITNTTPIIVTCPRHGDWVTRPANHISNNKKVSSGCPKCAAEKTSMRCTKSKEQFLKEAKRIHGNKYLYNKSEYNKTDIPITITCRKHGDFQQLPYIHLKGHGCPICSSSRGENKIALILDELGLKYVREYVIKTSEHRYRYDFYIPKLKLLIEYHGEQHFAPVKYFGGLEKYKQVFISDREKLELSLVKGMHIIVIPYDKNDDLQDYLVFSISLYYRYRDGDNFYRNFLELAKAKNWDKNATYLDAKPYLLYKRKT